MNHETAPEPAVPWRSTPAGKAAEGIIRDSIVASRSVAKALTVLHALVACCLVTLAAALFVSTRELSAEHAQLGRIFAETALAIGILNSLPWIRVRQTTRVMRSAGPGRPAPTLGLLERFSAYWYAVAFIIAACAGVDLIFSALAWLGSATARLGG